MSYDQIVYFAPSQPQPRRLHLCSVLGDTTQNAEDSNIKNTLVEF